MNARKTIVFLGDGMADEPVAQLGNRTPLQVAATPGMDRIASEGRCGTLLTLPQGFPTSSDVANMSVLGCDLHTEFCGRGPLEAAGRGIPLAPDQLAFRMNFIYHDQGILRDFSAGHLAVEHAEILIRDLNRAFGSDRIQFHGGVSYRNLLVLSGGLSREVQTDKPDDNHGQPVADHLPRAASAAGEETARLLCRLIENAGAWLDAHPVNAALRAAGKPQANGIWPWSGGQAGALRPFEEKYGVRGAVITAVDVIRGLGVLLGLHPIEVPGATGYIDTNYEGKAQAAVEALREFDFVYLHVEAIDEVSHAQDLELKIHTIEAFDRRVVQRVLADAPADTAFAVLPDHPVPIRLGKHTRDPVPLAVFQPGQPADSVQAFSEIDCPQGALGALAGAEFMHLLFRTGNV